MADEEEIGNKKSECPLDNLKHVSGREGYSGSLENLFRQVFIQLLQQLHIYLTAQIQLGEQIGSPITCPS